jgi:hypothetical protein
LKSGSCVQAASRKGAKVLSAFAPLREAAWANLAERIALPNAAEYFYSHRFETTINSSRENYS